METTFQIQFFYSSSRFDRRPSDTEADGIPMCHRASLDKNLFKQCPIAYSICSWPGTTCATDVRCAPSPSWVTPNFGIMFRSTEMLTKNRASRAQKKVPTKRSLPKENLLKFNFLQPQTNVLSSQTQKWTQYRVASTVGAPKPNVLCVRWLIVFGLWFRPLENHI